MSRYLALTALNNCNHVLREVMAASLTIMVRHEMFSYHHLYCGK